MIFSPNKIKNNIYKRNASIESKIIEGSAVLIDSNEGEMIRFNEIGTRVWQTLDGTLSVNAVIEILGREFDAPPGKIRKDVTRFLKSLAAMELVEEI